MSDRQPIGIDFGTTKTLASRWDERSQRPVPIRLGRGTDEIPTTVHVDRKGNYTFGEDAEDQEVCDPDGYFRRIKRDLGRSVPPRALPSGQSATSTELISSFLRHVRERIEAEALHGPVGHTVITVPALSGPAARADLETAAGCAGFEDFFLIEEPIAGGSQFLHDNPTSISGRNFAVFDWGGGTLDLAIIERIGEVFNAHPDLISGNLELGGEDIDDIFELAISDQLTLRGKSPLDQQPDEIRIMALRVLTDGKRILSKKPSYTFRLNLREGPEDLDWTRKQFEDVIANDVGSAIAQLKRLLAKSESAGVKVDGILLIGGTSEIPLVAQLIEQSTKLKPHRYDLGKEAVGLGAMLYAQRKASTDPLPINGTDIEQAISLNSAHLGQQVEFGIEVAGQTKSVKVTIPDNAVQGQRLRCSGQGMPGLHGGLKGDLMLVVSELEQATAPPLPINGALKSAYEIADEIAAELEKPRVPARFSGNDLRRENEVARGPLQQDKSISSEDILGTYAGQCVNTNFKTQASIVLVLRRLQGREIIGDLTIHGDLGGGSEFSGIISGNHLTFVTRSLTGKQSITWTSTISADIIEGSYAVVDEGWLMGLIGMRNQQGVWKCQKSDS